MQHAFMDPYRAPLPAAECAACRTRREQWQLAGKIVVGSIAGLAIAMMAVLAYACIAVAGMSGSWIGVG
jgi:hypothetical protein